VRTSVLRARFQPVAKPEKLYRGVEHKGTT
jgi:hypothetical protein